MKTVWLHHALSCIAIKRLLLFNLNLIKSDQNLTANAISV